MNKSNGDNQEDKIHQFIEDLNREKKPEVYRSEEAMNTDLEEMFETIRAVKRLKQGRKATLHQRILGSKGMKVAAAAAAFVLVIAMSIFNLTGPKNGNIVQAVVKAYEDLQSYSGVVEIRSERNGRIDFQETIDIQYKKPYQYTAHHRYDGVEKKYISDGKRLVTLFPNNIAEVENMFPEREIWRYHIGTTVWELEKAEEVNILGTEEMLGRSATALEYRYAGQEEYNKLWIDEATKLPLRKVLKNTPENRQLIVEFKELDVNPQLDDELFHWSDALLEDMRVREFNAETTLEQVKTAWPDLDKILETLPEGLEYFRAGTLEEYDFYRYVVRFRGETEADYLDVYFTEEPWEFTFFPASEVGKLADGYVELNPEAWNVFERYTGASRTGRWVGEEYDIFLVSSRDTDELQALLEQLAGESIQFMEKFQLMEIGTDPVPEKEGH